MKKKIVFATSNHNKVREVSSQIAFSDFNIISLNDIGFMEDIPETSDTFHGNALQKSKFIYDLFKTDVFSEDTGLEVTSLNMEPGVFTARYAGLQRSDEDNMNKLLENLQNIKDRSAQFRTVISLIYNEKEYFFEGIAKGTIALERSGDGGFGYDPIFIPDGFDKTFAHFTKEEKNQISHRGKAVQKLIDFLNSL